MTADMVGNAIAMEKNQPGPNGQDVYRFVRYGKSTQRSSRSSPQRLLNFNSTRTVWILSLLLVLTLITQVVLIAYHDEFVLQLNLLEGELLEDMEVLKLIGTDALNSAYEYTDVESFNDTDALPACGFMSRSSIVNDDRMNKFCNYSMEPVDILKRAGVDYSNGFVPSISVGESKAAKYVSNTKNQRQKAKLPTQDEIQSMYGNRPFIVGLERCDEFRKAVHAEDRMMGPAGMFNSATNLLYKLLRLNCVNLARWRARKKHANTGMKIQAPWGKHNPVSWRLHHEADVGGKGVRQADFLPIVMIKDPITWMASMCRHSYEARWRHTTHHCPNLVPNKHEKIFKRKPGKGTMGIKVKYATQHIGDEPSPDQNNKTFIHYTSLVDLWNIWYKQWHDARFPRLMVRFEDLLFHAEETVARICDCGGGTMKLKFTYVEDSAKGQGGPHEGSAGFLASLVTYGNRTLRMDGILTDNNDVEYARQHLDEGLMEMFGYAPI